MKAHTNPIPRSRQRRVTRESMIVRYMRQSRGLSLKQAGRRIGITGSAIAHIEQGRMDISRARLATLLQAYQYTEEEYWEFFEGKDAPVSLRDECFILLRDMEDSRLPLVHGMLSSLNPRGEPRREGMPLPRESFNRKR